MKVNLAGLLKQAAACIDPEKDDFGYAYMLGEEVPGHIDDIRSGAISLQEFADFYCLTPKEPST